MGQRASEEAGAVEVEVTRSPPAARVASSSAVLTQIPRYAAAAPRPMQPEVEPADSPLEAEADQAAREMVGAAPADRPTGPAAATRRAARVPDGGPTLRASRPEGGASVPAGRGLAEGIDAARSGGTGLPAGSRAFFEPRLGRDLSDVRVHADEQADGLSSAIQARAFTSGSDIFFRAAEFQPDTTAGQSLLAHELTHVAQQGGSGSPPVPLAQRVVALTPRWAARRPIARSPVTIQRAPDPPGGSPVSEGDVEVAGPAPQTAPEIAGQAEPAVLDAGALQRRFEAMLVASFLSSLGIPPIGTRIAIEAGHGLAEALIERFSGTLGQAVLAQLLVAGVKGGPQLTKGFSLGLVEGLVSPVTDLFGLVVLSERIRNFATEALLNPLSARAGIAKDVEELIKEVGKLAEAGQNAVTGIFKDPLDAVVFIMKLPDTLSEAAAKKAYEYGKRGGAEIAESIQNPLAEDEVKQEPKPSWWTSPAARIEHELSALKHSVLGTRLARIGNRIGYAVGWVGIQVVLLAFTTGIGNAIEQAAVGLGKIGALLGRISETVGTAAARVAGFIEEVGGAIRAVETAIFGVIGRLLKPAAKLLQPLVEALEGVLAKLRKVLTKLLGVAETETKELLETAAAKAAATKPSPPTVPKPEVKPPAPPAVPESAAAAQEAAKGADEAAKAAEEAATAGKGVPDELDEAAELAPKAPTEDAPLKPSESVPEPDAPGTAKEAEAPQGKPAEAGGEAPEWPPKGPSGPKPAHGQPGAAEWRYERYRQKAYKSGRSPDELLSFEDYKRLHYDQAAAGQRPGRSGGPEQVAAKKHLTDVYGVQQVENVNLGGKFPDGVRPNKAGGTDYFEVGGSTQGGLPESRERIKLAKELAALGPNDTLQFVDKLNPDEKFWIKYSPGDDPLTKRRP